MKRAFLILLIFLTACGTGGSETRPSPLSITPAPTAIRTPRMGGLYVDAASDLGPISPYIYGSNYGPWIAVPADMLDAAFNSGVTIIRFPGGAWGDRNELKNYQIDQFMTFIQQVGATASLSVRLRDGTPEEAAALVRYVNIEKQYNIRYWSIGNEPTLFSLELGRNYDTAEYNTTWRKFALAMKAVDPTILLLGPELHQYTSDPANQPKDSLGKDWMLEFLRANGEVVDVIAIHRYPFPRNEKNATIPDLRQNALEWDTTIPDLRALIHRETGRDLPIAVTEINSHYSKAVGGEGTPDSHYNAIWLADILGRMIRNGVLMVNQWLITSSGAQGSWGLVGRGELRPSYYVYQLYKQFGSELFYSASDDPNVSITAAQRADGTLTLMVINLASEPVQKTLTLDGVSATTAETWLFDSTHPAEQVADTTLTAPLTLPAESMTLLVITP